MYDLRTKTQHIKPLSSFNVALLGCWIRGKMAKVTKKNKAEQRVYVKSLAVMSMMIAEAHTNKRTNKKTFKNTA
jgi:hypothetical protein